MESLARCALLGAATGLRSMAAPSQLSRHIAELPREERPASAVADFLGRSSVRETLSIALFGEMIVDKLPFTPDRTDPGPLLGRIAVGAAAGVVLAQLRRGSVGLGAFAGGVGALAGAFAGYQARRLLAERAGLPDLVVALAEDAVAIAGARAAIRPDSKWPKA